jgi:hypothetical protein
VVTTLGGAQLAGRQTSDAARCSAEPPAQAAKLRNDHLRVVVVVVKPPLTTRRYCRYRTAYRL